MEPRVCTVFAEPPSEPQKRRDDGPHRSSLFASWVHKHHAFLIGKRRLVPLRRVGSGSVMVACPAEDLRFGLVRLHRVCKTPEVDQRITGIPRVRAPGWVD